MQGVYLQRIMKKNAAKGYKKTNPKQTQFPKWPKWTQISLSQRIMKMKHLQAPKKQTQTNPILPPILKISVLNFDNPYKILTTYEISFWKFKIVPRHHPHRVWPDFLASDFMFILAFRKLGLFGFVFWGAKQSFFL